MLPDRNGDKLLVNVINLVRYDDTTTGEVNYNSMHDNYVYEVEYPDITTEQIADNIIAEHML